MLLKEARIHWEYYHQYYPAIYTRWRVKKLMNASNALIDGILTICERSKTEDSPVYCLDARAEYYVWVERYKHLIKEKPELKELVITKLKEAADKTRSDNDYLYLPRYPSGEEIDMEQAINIFDAYLKELA